LSYYF